MAMDENLKASLGIDVGDLDEDATTDEIKEVKKLVLLEIKTKTKDPSLDYDVLTDYNYARTLIYTLLDKTGDAMENAYYLAVQSEQPRAYSTFTELANTVRSLTSDLISLHKTLKEVKRNNPDFAPPEEQAEETGSAKEMFMGKLSDIVNMSSKQNDSI